MTLYSSGPFVHFSFTAGPGAAFPGWWRERNGSCQHTVTLLQGSIRDRAPRVLHHSPLPSPSGSPGVCYTLPVFRPPQLGGIHQFWSKRVSPQDTSCLEQCSAVLQPWGCSGGVWHLATGKEGRTQWHSCMHRSVPWCSDKCNTACLHSTFTISVPYLVKLKQENIWSALN